MIRRAAAMAALLLVILSAVALAQCSDADQGTVDLTATYSDGTVVISGTAPSWVTRMAFEVYDEGGAKAASGFCPVDGGAFSASIRCDIGGYGSLRATASGVGYTPVAGLWPIQPSQVVIGVSSVSLSESSLTLRVTDTRSLTAAVSPSNATDREVAWSSSGDAVSVDGDGNVVALSVGTAVVTASAGGCSASCTVEVLPDATFTFLLRMDFCADEADFGLSGLCADDLRQGIALTYQAHDAGAALEAALDDLGAPCSFWSGGAGQESLKYWIESIFGLGDEHYDNGLWRYWIQYHEGQYNDLTLGYYTDGGQFSLIYGMTAEDGSVIRPAAVPSARTLVYDGSVQLGVAPSDLYYVEGGSARDAGGYTASLSLRDGCAWDDCTFGSRAVPWSISPATLTAAYVGETVLEGEPPSLAVSVTGFVGGETPSTAAGYAAPSVSCGPVPAGEYTLVPSGGSARNYTFEYVPGTLVVEAGVAVGDAFVSSGLVYTVTSLSPLEASLTGYESAPSSLRVPASVQSGGREFAVVSVGEKAFYGCTTLTSADLGGVSKVGVKAFAQCTRLRSVHAGDSLSTISAYAFCKCTRLVDFDLEDSLKALRAIGSYAFYKDLKLDSFSIPSFVDTLGKTAFSMPFQDVGGAVIPADAESLAGYRYVVDGGAFVRQPGPEVGSTFASGGLGFVVTASLPAEAGISGYSGRPVSVSVQGRVSDGGAEYDVTSVLDVAFKGCKTLRSIDLPGVSRIGASAFYGCTKLESAALPDAESIGVKAFARCSHLSGLQTGDRLTAVSAYAFFNCSSLESFDGGGSLKTVGSYAFSGCSSLRDVSLGPA
ncbi:MAG: leucine-rich repeat protein, partial [Candidatus Methanomethylophilaceae archaeon]|nr:leucine-rich repeat protein [Candidatus Methanomethylophilaceae archaeon]